MLESWYARLPPVLADHKPHGMDSAALYWPGNLGMCWHTLVEQHTYAGFMHRPLQVEPFNRALKEQMADVMINGRRRDHGFERAFLEVRSSLTGYAKVGTCSCRCVVL